MLCKLRTSQTGCSVNLKNILVAGLIICMLLGIDTIHASGTSFVNYKFNGDGNAVYPNEGYMYAYAYGYVVKNSGSGADETATSSVYNTLGNTVNYNYSARQTLYASCDGCCGSASYARAYNHASGDPAYSYCYNTVSMNCFEHNYKCNYNRTSNSNFGTRAHIGVYVAGAPSCCDEDRYAKCRSRLTISVGSLYNISGVSGCLDYVELYSDSTLLDSQNFTDNYTYSFDYLIPGFNYTLIYSDGHEYNFEIVDTNIVYNYNACLYTMYRFEESCGHLIPDSEGYYCEDWTGGGGICYTFYEADGILSISNTSLEGVTIYSNTFIGQKWWYFNNPIMNHTYNCINTAIDWGLKVIVQNASDGTLINDAMVRVNQSCYCTHGECVINPDQSCTCGGTSVRQKKTVNGTVSFGEMSLQDASLFVMTSGYKILDESSTEYSAFLSGRANFSSKTWIVKLAPNGDANESEWYEVSNKVDIHFRNEDGNRTSKILDTDSEVYLYYENNNSENEAMTLKFQSSSTHTYFSDEQSWTIAHDDIGHKTIANSYFTPWNYAYRAVIYNSSIYGWNLTIPLTVRNGTKEEDQHYENLTTNLWFTHEEDGKIDYREDMEIVSHAGSNNTTLMNIDLEIWKDGALLCYKNLTAADYTGASFPYYYVYEPVYDYVSGSNYTAKMYGFDRTLLEVRYLECMTDDTTRKNRLAIGVKDRTGANLNNCYIYLEDWGSLPTGTTYYNSYEGIDNGYYRYKATKSGYSGTGWADVTLSDNDEIVWYTLTEDYTNTSVTQQKLTDDDIKGIFFPLMFFLLIVIVFGGFKYVSN